ncbi:MAG: hypothetical protein ACLFWL_17050 [Candidatus Brocadiia bacterium]
MSPTIPYETKRDLAYAVQEAAQDAGFGRLTARPYNRFKPDETDWWLAPATDWPVYGQAKCQFFSCDLRPGYTAAVHLENGLDPEVEEAFTSSDVDNYLMDDSWAWHRFAELLKSGEIFDIIQQIATETSLEVCVDVLGGYMEDPDEFDPRDPDSLLKWDESVHLWMSDLQRLKLRRCKPRSDVLSGLEHSFDPPEFTDTILKAAGSSWTWLNVRIGASFLPEESSDGQEWSGDSIWERLLAPLMGPFE